jgi:hypothetical protein
MPGNDGGWVSANRQLAEQAKNRRPNLTVLFTTGYSRNAIVHQGRLDPGVAMIQKPITQDALAARIRDLGGAHIPRQFHFTLRTRRKPFSSLLSLSLNSHFNCNPFLSTHKKLSCDVHHAPHSITSSARASSVGGISRPNAFAVFGLMASSKFIWRLNGSSPG